MRFGVHVSVAGGLHQGLIRALEIGCETVQLFLVNPRSWNIPPLSEKDIVQFNTIRQNEARDIHPIVAHIPYLPNPASADHVLWTKSIQSLKEHLRRCDALLIDFLVLHFGKSQDRDGVSRMIEGIEEAYDGKKAKVSLLLENTAGQGSEMGYQVSELSDIYIRLPKKIKKGICLDTCHAYAAGYDLANRKGLKDLIQQFEQTIGFDEVKLIHLNDALKPVGSRVDRHAKIGEGHIGNKGFKVFLRNRVIKDLPCILEVPRKTIEEDISQLKLVKLLAQGKDK